MFDRFTERARRIVFFALWEARRFGSPVIDTEHLLLGLLQGEEEARLAVFLPDPTIRASIPTRVEARNPPQVNATTDSDLPWSKPCKRALIYSVEEADQLQHTSIGPEHLFLGLLREEDCFAAQLMQESGADLAQLRQKIATGLPPESGAADQGPGA